MSFIPAIKLKPKKYKLKKMKKLNFKNIKGMLSRDEMKKIKGGCGCSTVTKACCTDSDCGTNCTCYKPYGQTSTACYTKF